MHAAAGLPDAFIDLCRCSAHISLNAVFYVGDRILIGAVGTTKDAVAGANPVPDDPAATVSTSRRKRMDGAFETVKHVGFVINQHFKRFVVLVPTDFAHCHFDLQFGHARNKNRSM